MHTNFRILWIFILATLSFPLFAEDDAPEAAKAIYYAIDEPFTINFLSQSEQRVRYLQIKVSLMSHQQESIDGASANLPMLQDALRGLFAEQDFETVNSVEGRRTLQNTALATTNSILKQEIGSEPLDAVYFTSFVLQ